MTSYEAQLATITSGSHWNIQMLSTFIASLEELQQAMTAIADSPGWTGLSADFAREKFLYLKAQFHEMQTKATATQLAITTANSARTVADNAHAQLPDATVPEWIHQAAKVGGTALIVVPLVGSFLADTVVGEINKFLGSQREASAHKALQSLDAGLETPEQQLKNSRLDPNFVWPTAPPSSSWPGPGVSWTGDHAGNPGWSTNPTGTGGPHPVAPTPWNPGPNVVICEPPYPPITIPVDRPPTVSVDGHLDPSTTNGGFGGGLGAGLMGAGAAGGMDGAKLLTKPGAGGLFGGDGALVNGGSAAGAAGSKGGNSAMMGGHGGGGGGGSQKEKRSSLGLVAPKLDDDDEVAPRSAGAGAGGRE